MRGMMRMAVAAMVALLSAGCATNRQGGGGGQGGEMVRILVQNNGTIPTHARISLIPDAGGATARVGTMATLTEETMSITLPEINGTYRLRAEGGTGYVLTSPPLNLSGGEMVTWDMRLNRVRQDNP